MNGGTQCRLRLNHNLPVQKPNSLSHTCESQALPARSICDVKAFARVGQGYVNLILGLLQKHLNTLCATMSSRIMKAFLNDSEKAK